MPSTNKNQLARAAKIGDFQRWVDQLPEWWLRQKVVDAYWKGCFEGALLHENHELQQYFELETQYGIEMVPKRDSLGRTRQPRQKATTRKKGKRCRRPK